MPTARVILVITTQAQLTDVAVLARPSRLAGTHVVADQIPTRDGVKAWSTLTFVRVELTAGSLPLGPTAALKAVLPVNTRPPVETGVRPALVNICQGKTKGRGLK